MAAPPTEEQATTARVMKLRAAADRVAHDARAARLVELRAAGIPLADALERIEQEGTQWT